ncbi:flavoprotein [Planctomycetota bacterium]
MDRTRHILLGISGGIAAYKAVGLASRLTNAGHAVKTVMTASACQLVQPRSFAAVTHHPVHTQLWCETEQQDIEHISLVDWADAMVVAPATANIMGKMAGGICDDLLSTILCVCWEKPLLLAPAMNPRMWNNPRVQQNICTLKDMGVRFVGPESGVMACGDEGIGRLAEPEQIDAALQTMLTE